MIVHLGAACNCDPFWTDMNAGVCSDAYGNYLRADCSPVSGGEVIASITRPVTRPAESIRPTEQTMQDAEKMLTRFLPIGAAVLVIALLLRRR